MNTLRPHYNEMTSATASARARYAGDVAARRGVVVAQALYYMSQHDDRVVPT